MKRLLCLLILVSALAPTLRAADTPASQPSPAELRTKYGTHLAIVKATWGIPGKTVDLTSELQSLIKDDLLLTPIGKDWKDPAPNQPKNLDLSWWDGASLKSTTLKQTDHLRLLAANKINQPLPWLDKLIAVKDTSADKSPEGIKVTTNVKANIARLLSADPVKTPLVITAIARTDANSIRVYFGDRGEMLVNWETNNTEFRHHDPRSGEQTGVPGKGAIPRNQFVTIRWTIDSDKSRIEVDGIERASFKGDYSNLVGRVGIGTLEGTAITVKSFQLSFLPERAPAPGVSLAGLPTLKEITDLIDAAKYQQALAPLGRLIDLKGPAAASFDRHQLLMLRAECLLQLKQNQSCMQALATAAKEAPSPQKLYEAVAFAYLIQKSPRGTYTSDRADRGAWFDMMDRTKRKDVYKVLWEDEQVNLVNLLKPVTDSAALPPIMAAARPIPTARACEYVATGATQNCDKLSEALRTRARTLLDAHLDTLSRTTDNLTNIASSKIITRYTDGRTVERRVGLNQAQTDELKGVEASCTQAIAALQELVSIFPDDQSYKDLGNRALAIGKKAENTRTTLY